MTWNNLMIRIHEESAVRCWILPHAIAMTVLAELSLRLTDMEGASSRIKHLSV